MDHLGRRDLMPDFGSHIAAARKRSHQWCVSLTPNNIETIERMTCHCFLRRIARDLTSATLLDFGLSCLCTFEPGSG